MRKAHWWKAVLAVAALATALLGGGCGGDGTLGGGSGSRNQGPTIRIGEYGSLTGDAATFGKSTHQSLLLAVNEANEGDGIHGHRIDLRVYDDASKNEEAANVVQRLINQDRVVAVFGEVASGRSLQGAPVCQNAGIPMLTPSSTNPRVTEIGDFIFRACFLDDFQGYILAQFARETLGARTMVILQDIKQDYSTGLAEFAKKEFEAMGGRVLAVLSYSQLDTDFRSQLSRVKNLNPDVLVSTGYYNEGGLIAKQARELGYLKPLLAGDGWDSNSTVEIGGEAVEGAHYVVHAPVYADDAKIQEFVQRYQQEYGEMPDSLAVLAYDAARLLLDAIERAGDPAQFTAAAREELGASASAGEVSERARRLHARAIRDALAATRDFAGLSGTITMGPDRNPVKGGFVVQIQEGIPVPVATVEPRDQRAAAP